MYIYVYSVYKFYAIFSGMLARTESWLGAALLSHA